MENQLVRTDKFLYKVKRFFRLLFIKNNSQFLESQENTETIKEELEKIISCKTEAQENTIKSELARKLMENELPIKDLGEEEIEEMIQFFQDDIKLKSNELSDLKKEIMELKKLIDGSE